MKKLISISFMLLFSVSFLCEGLHAEQQKEAIQRYNEILAKDGPVAAEVFRSRSFELLSLSANNVGMQVYIPDPAIEILNHHLELPESLLRELVKPPITNDFTTKETPLHRAVKTGDSSACSLVSSGYSPYDKDDEGKSAIDYADKKGQTMLSVCMHAAWTDYEEKIRDQK